MPQHILAFHFGLGEDIGRIIEALRCGGSQHRPPSPVSQPGCSPGAERPPQNNSDTGEMNRRIQRPLRPRVRDESDLAIDASRSFRPSPMGGRHQTNGYAGLQSISRFTRRSDCRAFHASAKWTCSPLQSGPLWLMSIYPAETLRHVYPLAGNWPPREDVGIQWKARKSVASR
jgi:hypothetical protein